MAKQYKDNEIAEYIDLYSEMHQASAVLNSSLTLYHSSSRELKVNLRSPIVDFVRTLREKITRVREQVPEQVRKKVSSGKTPDQLESLAINTLLEIDKPL